MAARAILRKVSLNPQAFSIIGADRTRRILPRSAVAKAADPPGMVKTSGDVELWNKKLEEEHQRLLSLVEGLKNFKRSLLSIQHHRRKSGGGGIIKFTTTSQKRGLTSSVVRRLALPESLGPYELPKQAVKGVVCITTPSKAGFLLYNPTTGDTSPWIETTTTREAYETGKARREVESIALGFDSRTEKHKVMCISSYIKEETSATPETEEEEDDKLLVVEVLNVHGRTWTTGAHKWRKMKKNTDGPSAFEDGERFVLVDGPVYVDDEIHWQFRHGHLRDHEFILGIHVGREDFSYTPIPEPLSQEFMDSSQHVRSMLMEVDGKIAILKSTPTEKTSLWTCEILSKIDRYGVGINWAEEKVLIPYADVCPGSSIVALTGTYFIFIQSHGRISYYDRKTNKVSPYPGLRSLNSNNFDLARIMEM